MAHKRRRRGPPLIAAGILERFDNHVLIALPDGPLDAPRLWRFPRGPVAEDESPEAAMRRVALELLGVRAEIVVGQPPLAMALDGRAVELRYFYCGLIGGTLTTRSFREVRWVSKAHLREYDFDAASAPVAEWLAGARP